MKVLPRIAALTLALLPGACLDYEKAVPASTLPTDTAVAVDDTGVAADDVATTTATDPTDTAVAPDDTAVTPDDTATTPDDTSVAPDDTTTVEPEIPVIGEDLTWGAAPSGFSANLPTWADDGQCTSDQWWIYSSGHETKNMHPGRACIDCHSREHGPSFRFAGTVFANVNDVDECRGVGGVKVEILKDDGSVLAATTTFTSGNFYFSRLSVPAVGSYRTRLTFDGRTREMTDLVVGTKGDCNTCHSDVGSNDAPGRIVAP